MADYRSMQNHSWTLALIFAAVVLFLIIAELTGLL